MSSQSPNQTFELPGAQVVDSGDAGSSFEEVDYVEEVVYEEVEEDEDAKDMPMVSSAVSQEVAQPPTGKEETPPSNTSETIKSSTIEVIDPEFKEIDEKAQKVVKEVQEVAKDVSKKLTEGFKTALGSASGATSRFTGGWSSWLHALDNAVHGPAQAGESYAASSREINQTAVKATFGLDSHEDVMEQFQCQLLQTYTCGHNKLTGTLQMTYPGHMTITSHHVCFQPQDPQQAQPFKISLKEIASVARLGDHSLKMNTKEPSTYLTFGAFSLGPSALEGALALVEHLAGESESS